MRRTLPLAALLLFGTGPAVADTATAPQYVVISFDGAGPIERWERSRALASRSGAHFTYFLSCVFLLSQETRQNYQPPQMKPGRSNVGFAASGADVAARLGQIWTARGEGHEIGSHGCGHFDGKDWSRADWSAEFAEFARITRDAWAINGISGEPEGWRSFAETEITGFRAPYLSTGRPMEAALAAAGFTHDASGVSKGPAVPEAQGPVATYSLPMIPEGPAQRPVIAMDYNFYVRHSAGEERPAQAAAFADRAYEAFMAAFDREAGGRRRPLQIGFHFTLMNDGAYWRALERFAGDVCTRADVRCVSYRELNDILFPKHTSDTDD